ncbi:unnamed protein product, partial [Gulo gulo]
GNNHHDRCSQRDWSRYPRKLDWVQEYLEVTELGTAAMGDNRKFRLRASSEQNAHGRTIRL